MISTGSIAEIQALISQFKSAGKKIGFVPTMGALHQGHLSLVATAKETVDIVVCSIYVNPTQFNNQDDLKQYPRNIDADKNLLAENGCDLLFLPSDEVMYAGRNTIKFEFGDLDRVMEGKFRPGHFSGVALIVSKFFNIVLPNCAFFGQKDLQQLTIIKKLVEELFFNLEIISVPIKREHHGLAMSSRNERLSKEEREEAKIFYKALSEAKAILKEGQSAVAAKEKVNSLLSNHKAQLEYFEIVSDKDLLPKTENYLAPDTVLCIAGFMGNVRLIDNMYLNEN
ncbi:pantothenate synthetase [Marivirga tractuosa]|uniref:Pantothenate synthetase n=1 Tax=Marivirga tractuosa (strain ATCC 23168 / DSM 4126 / NBRC 15989 / NCIMB 1408 / VKM B-1430 / H-43) TaxID=643867 RepID=E4TUB7_MARTH|nr:pantoate--beta-alanine ligase [Marivirga tractuosa]ADR22035.1 pantothenate synthetase [Marivirga tractuosa DSM 4126]BDD13506.1 pantothenate synthetase [Marivirga tractuosa]